jgi:hypothetical protein
MRNDRSENVPANIPLTMSTLEISGLTGKAHKHVLADARKMLLALEIQPAEFSARYLDAKGEAREVLNLPKRECLILVSGYSVEMRARIIDRWLELEAAISGAGAVEPLDEAGRRVIGGIVKGVVHKEIASLLPAMVEAAIAADARRAVLDYASVRQLLEEAGAVSKGRKSLNRRIGYRLGLIARGEGGARRCPHTGVWLYPRVMADRFMREEGSALVKEHNDRASGQGVLRLVKKGREDRLDTHRGV